MAHPAWTDALGEVLRRAAEGPGTILLVGPPGTGKSVMLRHLAILLGNERISVTVVRQGDLPFSLHGAGVLLIDEAWRMLPDRLRTVLSQRQEIVVLADTDRLASASEASGARVVRLRPLSESESRAFAVDWLRQTDAPEASLTPEALARVAVHANGAVRLVVQLLTATIAVVGSAGQTAVAGADVDHAATMRRNWMVMSDPARPAEPVSLPVAVVAARRRLLPHRRVRRAAAALATALAACLVLAWQLRTGDVPAPRPIETAALPALQMAKITIAAAATTDQPSLAQPPAAGPADMAAPPGASPVTRIELAAAAPPPDLADDVATMAPQTGSLGGVLLLERSQPARLERRRPAGGPGMILLAQRGDTLESLYSKLYQGRAAPPYAEVVAINSRPVQAGTIVVFPEPPGGWSVVQR